jgi:hypothetical protein
MPTGYLSELNIPYESVLLNMRAGAFGPGTGPVTPVRARTSSVVVTRRLVVQTADALDAIDTCLPP